LNLGEQCREPAELARVLLDNDTVALELVFPFRVRAREEARGRDGVHPHQLREPDRSVGEALDLMGTDAHTHDDVLKVREVGVALTGEALQRARLSCESVLVAKRLLTEVAEHHLLASKRLLRFLPFSNAFLDELNGRLDGRLQELI